MLELDYVVRGAVSECYYSVPFLSNSDIMMVSSAMFSFNYRILLSDLQLKILVQI